MSADKRTVTTDALETLGTLITANEKRDAIHLAVENVVAKQLLLAGEHVTADGHRVGASHPHAVGIVDPFLTDPVEEGQRFWLVIYPRQIHSLRHVWTHPAFPDAPEVKAVKPLSTGAASEQWLIDWCSKHDCPSWSTVRYTIEGHGAVQGHPDYLHFIGHDAHAAIPPEFWVHVENVLGYRLAGKPSFFSCSC